LSDFIDDDDDEDDGRQRKAARLGIRSHDPKSYGHIPGVPIGQVFETRMAASTAAIHAPTVAGIFGVADDTEVCTLALFRIVRVNSRTLTPCVGSYIGCLFNRSVRRVG
jgi:hypothetical protein